MKRNTLRNRKKGSEMFEPVSIKKFQIKETLVCADHIVEQIMGKIKWHIEYQEVKHKIKPFTVG